jgi:DNA-directed RNA polymerase specialized sigma24 family protein
MYTSSQPAEHGRMLAACAVALATAVGSTAVGSPAPAGSLVESRTIAQLERYCSTSWRNAGIRRDDWEDCTQQALLEMLERVSLAGLPVSVEDSESLERRELNRTVWRLAKRNRRAARFERFDESCPLRDGGPAGRSAAPADWDDVSRTAAELLTERQIEILELSRDGWKVAEVARRLGLSPERVSDEKYKAIAKLRDRLAPGSEE